MENLPDVMLEMIFSNLSVKDKLTLFLVCKRFGMIVADSLKLMSNIKISIILQSNYIFLGSISNTSRKYQHLEIRNSGIFMKKLTDSGSNGLLDLLHQIRKTLKTLILKDLIFPNSSYLVKMLELTPNLETIESSTSIYKNEDEENQEPELELNLPNLKNLIIRFYCENYFNPFKSLLKNCKNLNQIYLSHQTNSDDEMKDFLLNQKFLVHLGLHAKSFVNIFENSFVQLIPFRLKSLDLSFDCKFKNVLNFLETQTQLEELKLSCFGDESDEEYLNAVALMDLVLKFPKLRKFDPFFFFESYGVNFENKWCPQMEELKLNLGGFRVTDPVLLNEVANFVKIMPNLKVLHVCMSYHAHDDELKFLNQLSHLETLHLGILRDASVMRHFHLKNLKTIKFVISHEAGGGVDKMMSEEDWMPFFEKHQKITSIQLYGTYFSESLWIFIEENLTELKKVAFEVFGNDGEDEDTDNSDLKIKFNQTVEFLKNRSKFSTEKNEYNERSLVLNRISTDS